MFSMVIIYVCTLSLQLMSIWRVTDSVKLINQLSQLAKTKRNNWSIRSCLSRIPRVSLFNRKALAEELHQNIWWNNFRLVHISFKHLNVQNIFSPTPDLCDCLCAGEDGGGEWLEEECGSHVGHGGPQEDVWCGKGPQPVNGCYEQKQLALSCTSNAITCKPKSAVYRTKHKCTNSPVLHRLTENILIFYIHYILPYNTQMFCVFCFIISEINTAYTVSPFVSFWLHFIWWILNRRKAWHSHT